MSRRADDPGEPSTDATASVDPKQADSAGVPWAGRSFEPNPHSADDGRAPEALAAALRRFRSGDGGQGDVVAEFARACLLILLLAELGDGGSELGAHGLDVDKSQELSIVIVAGSGTGQLTGITGTLGIEIVDKKHFYSVEYELG